MMCFYCLVNFDEYFSKKLARDNQQKKLELLNLYI